MSSEFRIDERCKWAGIQRDRSAAKGLPERPELPSTLLPAPTTTPNVEDSSAAASRVASLMDVVAVDVAASGDSLVVEVGFQRRLAAAAAAAAPGGRNELGERRVESGGRRLLTRRHFAASAAVIAQAEGRDETDVKNGFQIKDRSVDESSPYTSISA